MSRAELVMLFGPAAVVLAGALGAIIIDGLGRARVALTVAVASMLGAGVWSGWTALTEPASRVFGALGMGAGFSGLAAILLVLGALGALALAGTGGTRSGVGAALIAVGTLASAVAVASLDLVLLLLALETAALCGYGLVALRGSDASDEAAIKYFVQGSLATGFFAFGVAVLVGLGGTTALPELGLSLLSSQHGEAAVAGIALLIAALAFKAGAAPFHAWVPDAYGSAQPGAVTYLASVPKVAALFAAFIVFRKTLGGALGDDTASLLFALVATASIVLGNLAALRQASYGRMLGYSAIAQTGYAFVALAAGQAAAGSGDALFPLLVLAVFYAIAAAGAFSAAEAVAAIDREWDGSVGGLAGLGRRKPLLAAAVAVCMLSLTGIPLTAGFWGKFLVFGTVVTGPLLWLALVGVVGSVVSFGYYGGVLRSMYLDEVPDSSDDGSRAGRIAVGEAAEEASATAHVTPWLPELVAVISAVVVMAGGVYPLFGGFGPLARLLTLP